jgi:hypothetical protein
MNSVGTDINSITNEIFDLSYAYFLYPDNIEKGTEKEHEGASNKLRNRNSEVYDNIFRLIEEDVKATGIPLTNTSKILIGDLAMNLALLHRARLYVLSHTFKEIPEKIRPIESSRWGISYKIFHKKTAFHNLIEKDIPRLEKQIYAGIKALGLLPYQQLERQKVTIVQTMKQKLSEQFANQERYKIESEKEVCKTTKFQNQFKQKSGKDCQPAEQIQSINLSK